MKELVDKSSFIKSLSKKEFDELAVAFDELKKKFEEFIK